MHGGWGGVCKRKLQLPYHAVEDRTVVRAGLPPHPVLVLAEGIPIRVRRRKEIPEHKHFHIWPILDRSYKLAGRWTSEWKGRKSAGQVYDSTFLTIYTTKSNGATHYFCNELSELSGNVWKQNREKKPIFLSKTYPLYKDHLCHKTFFSRSVQLHNNTNFY